ncbi:hypothetical protein ABZ942_36895 [Nocardia sp. NPDC046473]|uniref:hypothetical protein n=1 Tax=Nocardia sp. NPDC046473 TaxID=3155733 RepID=UPI003402EA19
MYLCQGGCNSGSSGGYVPLIAAAVCPHPPMLIPEVAGSAAALWGGLRTSCVESIRRLRFPKFGDETDGWAIGRTEEFHTDPTLPDLLVIVGGDDTTMAYDSANTYGSLGRYGIDWSWDIAWCMGNKESLPLPMSLSVGLWLATASGPDGLYFKGFEYQSVSFDASPRECAALGEELAERKQKVVMLVLAEGAATEQLQDSAAGQARTYNAMLAQSLARADATALGQLDPRWAQTLNASGRAPLQVLAGATGGQHLTGQLISDPVSHDAGLFVASWTQSETNPGTDLDSVS